MANDTDDSLSKQDEQAFDALLEEPAASPSASLESLPAGTHSVPHVADHTPHAHETAPTWDELVAGWELYRDPIACGVIAGLVLGILGVFIVLRRAVFVTAAVSQSAGLGVALALFFQIHHGVRVPPVLSAVILGLFATALLAWRSDRRRLPREAIVALAYLAASAAAVLVGDRITQEAHDIASILFGTAVLVRPEDFAAVTGASVVVLAVLGLFHRGFVFAGFDPEGARVQGLPVRFLELSLWLLVAVEVSAATRALGALPVFAFAVMPAMAALALVERMRWAWLISALGGAAAAAFGYLFAFFYEFPVGASQAALATLFFLACIRAARWRPRAPG